MTLFFLLALTAFIVAALIWWAFREPGARTISYALIALMLVPLPAAAGALDAVGAALAPHLPTLMEAVLIPFVIAICVRGMKTLGLDMEAKHRAALHSALTTGAQLALKHELTGKTAVDLILRYVVASVPDAIKGLGAGHDVMTDLAKAKLEQVAQVKAKEAAGAAVDALTGALRRAGLPAT